MNEQKVREFKKTVAKFLREFEGVDEHRNLYGVRDILYQAIALLKQPECETCNDKISEFCSNPKHFKPDEQPLASEFTKDIYSILDMPNDESCKDESYIKGLESLARLACDRLDKAEAEIKTFAEWRSRLEQLAKSDNAVVKAERAKAGQFQDEVQELKQQIKELEAENESLEKWQIKPSEAICLTDLACRHKKVFKND